MNRGAVLRLVGVVVALAGTHAMVTSPPQFVDLFNGKNLKGWVNVNTAEDTWRVKNGAQATTGSPGSRARCFHACTGSLTARGSSGPRDGGPLEMTRGLLSVRR